MNAQNNYFLKHIMINRIIIMIIVVENEKIPSEKSSIETMSTIENNGLFVIPIFSFANLEMLLILFSSSFA